ncbi:cytidylyltransferase domain-containing protein [Desulfocurvus sp. DL9XJH121]
MEATGKPRIVALIEARMKSSRLPGKVMLDLAGRPMLMQMAARVARSRLLDDVVVATTDTPSDDIVAQTCADNGVKVFRGSENDVLDRLLAAAREHGADVIVQLTGDCPLIDHRHIDRTIEHYLAGRPDYACNNMPPSLPIGFDVRMFPSSVLEDVGRRTQDPIDRVHGSYYIYTHPELYSASSWTETRDMWPELRLTVDEYLDFRLARRVFEALLPVLPDFSAEDIVTYLRQHPELAALNRGVRQKRPEEG